MKIDPTHLEKKETHDLLVGATLPRPIAFISTIDESGIFNLAPYSFCIPLPANPPVVGIGIGRRRDGSKKDTLLNIEATKDFVFNIVPGTLAEVMNQTSAEYPREVDEFQMTGLTPVKADLVKSPRLAESPINMECRLVHIQEYGEFPQIYSFVVGEVLRVHVRDEFWVNGEIQSPQLGLIGRMGGNFYCRTTDVFEMKKPVIPEKK